MTRVFARVFALAFSLESVTGVSTMNYAQDARATTKLNYHPMHKYLDTAQDPT